MDAITTASKRAIQKTTEATGDLIGNKISDKTTSFSKNFDSNSQIKAPKRKYISPEERQQIIYELRLVQQYSNGISKNSEFGTKQSIKSTI